ncbi:hypothetical protein FKM82_026608 [Ascaphus truei]
MYTLLTSVTVFVNMYHLSFNSIPRTYPKMRGDSQCTTLAKHSTNILTITTAYNKIEHLWKNKWLKIIKYITYSVNRQMILYKTSH